ncbi:MAG: iron-sulfur cluster assembly scaffold protein [Bifidobacteriaceae bacterium]|nr:iron-sulfur cluster assembly scaffold protein [Bifidobacteriaceae bacterium]
MSEFWNEDLAQLYQSLILDVARKPFHKVDEITVGAKVIMQKLQHLHSDCPISHQVNPTCGDELYLQAKIVTNKSANNAVAEVDVHANQGETSAAKSAFDRGKLMVDDLNWAGSGCSISEASTSIMIKLIMGTTIESANKTLESFEHMLTDLQFEPSEEEAASLGDAMAFYNVRNYPNRIKCALLGWMSLKDLLQNV